MGDIPETRYARTDDGAHIAFQVLGAGPPDLVYLGEGASHVDLAWDIAAYERVFRRMASFSRLILFDTRGSGQSDPLGLSEQPSLEGQAKDMLAVLEAAGAERAAVAANSLSGLLGLFFAVLPTRNAPRPSSSTAASRGLPVRPTTPGGCRSTSSSRSSLVSETVPGSWSTD